MGPMRQEMTWCCLRCLYQESISSIRVQTISTQNQMRYGHVKLNACTMPTHYFSDMAHVFFILIKQLYVGEWPPEELSVKYQSYMH